MCDLSHRPDKYNDIHTYISNASTPDHPLNHTLKHIHMPQYILKNAPDGVLVLLVIHPCIATLLPLGRPLVRRQQGVVGRGGVGVGGGGDAQHRGQQLIAVYLLNNGRLDA